MRRRSRLVVMAVSALHRRAVSELMAKTPEVELRAVCASLAAAVKKVEAGDIDIVAVAQTALDSLSYESLRELTRIKGTKLVVYAPGQSPEETIGRILDGLPGTTTRNHSPPVLSPRADDWEPASLVVIGSSTGGPDALTELIPLLPEDFEPPVLIAQHMPSHFTSILAERLNHLSRLSIKEAEHGDALESGRVLLAPGDFHLEVHDDGLTVGLHQGPPENSCRPAVDVLFRSVARVFGRRSLAVILTGMGRDGLLGARQLHSVGAEIVAQDEASSVVWGMPGLIARDGIAHLVAPIPDIAARLISRAPPPRARAADERRNEVGDLP